MVYKLSSKCSCRSKTHTINYVIKSLLEQLDKQVTWHHAGQGQPGDHRVADDGGRARVRERHHRRPVRAIGKSFRAERDDAGRGRRLPRVDHAARRLRPQPVRALHRRAAGDRPRTGAGRAKPDARDRVEPDHRLRRGGQDRQGVDANRPVDPPAGAYERYPRGHPEQGPRPREDDQAGPRRPGRRRLVSWPRNRCRIAPGVAEMLGAGEHRSVRIGYTEARSGAGNNADRPHQGMSFRRSRKLPCPQGTATGKHFWVGTRTTFA